MKEKIRTGILGGTFDPVHRGHLAMALSARRDFDLAEVWIMPNGSPPHKNDRLITATPTQRLAMVELAIADLNRESGTDCELTACDYEVRRRKTSYSYETMEHFTAQYPDREFYFIIGGDSLHDLGTWVKPERLLKTCVMLVAVRGSDDADAVRETIRRYEEIYDVCDIRVLSMETIDISSTKIRSALLEGKDISAYVTPSVAEYITSHEGLYAKKKSEAGEQRKDE